jgi:hypothetical protein
VVSGGVALRVGFGFDNAPTKPGAGEFADYNFADEKAGQGDGIRRQFGTAKAPDGNESFAGC